MMMTAPMLSEEEFQLLQRLVHRETGIMLGDTKRALLEARLLPRVRALGLRSFLSYYRLLRDGRAQPAELQQLVDAVTTHTTSLFREVAHFEFVAREVAPAWVRRRAQGGAPRIRCWSAACSTGEEAYSLAAVLRASGVEPPRFDVKILATDISTRALERAAAGRYPLSALEAVPRAWRGSFVPVSAAGHLAVVESVRAMVALRPLNLLAELFPFRGRFELIFCRNVLIYFDEETRRRLVQRLVGCLNPGGYLILGLSEALLTIPRGLVSLGRSIYRSVRPGGSCDA